ncbi:MAG: CRISPR-associated endonuclease Cas1 [bacterium]
MQAKARLKVCSGHPGYSPGPARVYHPRQLALFTSTPDPIPIGIHWEPDEGEEVIIDEGLSMIKNKNSSQLLISGFGVFLEQENERLIVSREGKTVYKFPLHHMNEVIISSRGISISSGLIADLCQRGIRLSLLSSTGRPLAMITSPLLTSTTLIRREQILAFQDQRGVEVSKAILSGKFHNQEKLVLLFHKSLKQKDPQRAEKIQEAARSITVLRGKVKKITGESIDEIRAALLEVEEEGNRMYWEAVRKIIDRKFEFLGRVHQQAAEAIRSMLNYGYGLLYSQIWGAVLQAGLEPFAGFLHVDQPGRSSLVLDLAEEFGQPVVDLPIISQVNLGEINRVHNGLLDPETRESIGQKILERLGSTQISEDREYQIRSIIQIQARHLASFLRGEEGKYKPFRFKW